ncbi:MAG: hypothetical protein GXO61_05590 [Epsilonproteobacteria bacterium]|nr:hypothetical protein [Campylobacterota bacterium]
MKRFLSAIILVVLGSFATASEDPYLQGLKEFLTQKGSFKINGYFMPYDFDKNSKIDYNDWIYISSDGRAFRLLGTTPNENNAFGFESIELPTEEINPIGYFVFINFPQDMDKRFSWLYITTSKKVFKLMGADENHYFKYLDVNKDGRADDLLKYLENVEVEFKEDVPKLGPTKVEFIDTTPTTSSSSESSETQSSSSIAPSTSLLPLPQDF